MRLLVVEDEPDLLAGLARALRKQGYAVDAASDGEDGLYKATSTDYDAIVLDVMLPKLDGWEVLSRLRKTKATPVLMLTARDRRPIRHDALKLPRREPEQAVHQCFNASACPEFPRSTSGIVAPGIAVCGAAR